jgi:hypothetical protein
MFKSSYSTPQARGKEKLIKWLSLTGFSAKKNEKAIRCSKKYVHKKHRLFYTASYNKRKVNKKVLSNELFRKEKREVIRCCHLFHENTTLLKFYHQPRLPHRQIYHTNHKQTKMTTAKLLC